MVEAAPSGAPLDAPETPMQGAWNKGLSQHDEKGAASSKEEILRGATPPAAPCGVSLWPPWWPVLLAVRPVAAPLFRQTSSRRWRSRAGPQSRARSVAPTSPDAPAPILPVSSRCSRHYSYPRRLKSPVESTSEHALCGWPVFRWPQMTGFWVATEASSY